jgi:hypothetical protein
MLRRFNLLTAAVCCLVLVSFSPITRGQDAPAKEATPATETAPAEAAPPAATDDAAPAETAAEPAKTEPEPAADPKTETPPKTPDAAPAEPAPASEVAAQPGDAVAAFAAKLDEWKALLKDLRVLQTEYNEADDDALVPFLKQWNEQMAKGEQLLRELAAVGSRFLVKLLADDSERDAYEQAAVVSQALIDNGCDVSEIFSQGAVAAFCTNSFDKAETYFKIATERGGLSEEAQKYLSLLAEYRTYWEEEQKIREKEAAADDLPRVKITTSKGDLIVELFENEAPGAVGNFISLVEKGFYDGLTFHRVFPRRLSPRDRRRRSRLQHFLRVQRG